MKYTNIKKRALLLLFSTLSSFFLQAQVVTIAGPGAGTSGLSVFGQSNYHVSEHIYDQAEIGVAMSIDFIKFSTSTIGTPAYSNISIYLKESTVSSFTTTTATYSTAGYTLVYSGPIGFTTAGTYEGVNLTTPFNFTNTAGTNLHMMLVRQDNATHTHVFNTASTATGKLRRYNGTVAVSGTTVLNQLSGFRAAVQFGHTNNNDISVANIYTLGKLPIEFGAPTTIQASIKNEGVLTQTNIPVSLNISGANIFSDVQTIPSLAPGASVIVDFAPYSPISLSTGDIVEVTLPSDDNIANNLKQWSMDVTQNVYSYKNPAVGNTGGVGFNGATGDFVAKFNSNIGLNFPYNLGPPQISEIKVDFNGAGQSYQMGIWDATGAGGTPGTLLWQSSVLTTAIGTSFIPVPNVTVGGDYFVGVRQIGTTNVSFSYQTENPIRPSTFYYTSPTGGTTWTDFAPSAPFRFSVEVTVKIPSPPNCAINQFPANGEQLNCYTPVLSWGSGGGAPTGYDVYFSTSQLDVDLLLPTAIVSSNQTGTTYTPTTTLNTNTTYYWNVIPKNIDGDATGCTTLSFTTGAFPNCYCTPTHTNNPTCTDQITNVTLATLNNTSTCPPLAYTLYSTPITQVTAGSVYNLSVTTNNNNILSLWIDYNQDGILDATEWTQIATTTTANTATTIPITIPATATTGNTLMRIRSRLSGNVNGATDACTPMGSGESEDYVLDILPQPLCSGQPTPGNTLASITTVCPGQTVNLSLQNITIGSGVTYQWEEADDAAFTVNANLLGTASTESIVFATSKYYRCLVSCVNSGLSAYSTPVHVMANSAINCYCASGATVNADEEIYNVTVNGASTNPLYSGANGCTTIAPGPNSVLGGYSNFTTLGTLTTLPQGGSVPFQVDEDECDGAIYYACGIAIWIDFNQDGDFDDAGEEVYMENTSLAGPRSATGNIAIPATATLGVTRMRVTAAEGFAGTGVLTPCLSYGYGETEDYFVEIVPGNATLSLTAFIQGYYAGSNTQQAVLVNQGISTNPTDCDDITVELHDATAPYAVAATFTGVLQTNGTISCTFPNTVVGNSYYIVLVHRNSVQTWSAAPVLMSTNTSYNFSTSASQAFGGNEVDAISDAVFSMYNGDVNQDGFIDIFDFLDWDVDNQNFASGYFATDFNGDGFVDIFDFLVWDPNNQNFIGIVTP
ncbi:MAG: GEVED domain-containing protein [Chitinophagaceae bacterium]